VGFLFFWAKNQCLICPLLISEEEKADVAAAFQETALTDIVIKALNAASAFGCQAIFCGGGVSNSTRLKEIFKEKNTALLPLFFPSTALTMDNAAMIAGLGYHLFIQNPRGDAYDLEPNPSRKTLL
jgi:N6-L-threonylcarbamoyladenine synthase